MMKSTPLLACCAALVLLANFGAQALEGLIETPVSTTFSATGSSYFETQPLKERINAFVDGPAKIIWLKSDGTGTTLPTPVNLPGTPAEIATFGDRFIVTVPSAGMVFLHGSMIDQGFSISCLDASSPGTVTVANGLAYIACGGGKVAIMRPDGSLVGGHPFQIPTPNGYAGPPSAFNMTPGPDGKVWFTQTQPTNAQGQPVIDGKERIGTIDPAGAIAQFNVPSNFANTKQNLVLSANPIIAGGDGNTWVSEAILGKILRITPAGVTTEFPIPTTSNLTGLGAGADGNIWAHQMGGKFMRVTPTGIVTVFDLPTPDSSTDANMIVAPDGAFWFGGKNTIGRITTTGKITQYEIAPPAANVVPIGLQFSPAGIGTFAESGTTNVASFPLPANTSPLLAAVLPASRSVQVGVPATAFATMINADTTTATGCKPAMLPGPLALFSYQTTDPTTNALTGTKNTPADIPPGGKQTFVIVFNPLLPFNPVNARIGFTCTNKDAASMVLNLNTLLVSASATAVPDIVALGATTTNDGTLHIPGSTASAAFAVATSNVGDTGTITVKPRLDAIGSLPLLDLTICQTNPQTGACLAPPAESVTTTIAEDATPTFAIFAKGNGVAVPFSPGKTRILVEFSDQGGVVRGSTSVAVTTE